MPCHTPDDVVWIGLSDTVRQHLLKSANSIRVVFVIGHDQITRLKKNCIISFLLSKCKVAKQLLSRLEIGHPISSVKN